MRIGVGQTGYADFCFAIVGVNGRQKRKTGKKETTLSLMGFGDKKLPASGPSPLFLAVSSVAEQMGELKGPGYHGDDRAAITAW